MSKFHTKARPLPEPRTRDERPRTRCAHCVAFTRNEYQLIDNRYREHCTQCWNIKNDRVLIADAYVLKYCKRCRAQTPTLKNPNNGVTACAPCYYADR